MVQCKAVIVKINKHRKDRSRHPNLHIPQADKGLKVCGGSVTFKSSVTSGCCCHDSAEVEVEAICSRCNRPYFDGLYELQRNPLEVFDKLLEGYHG